MEKLFDLLQKDIRFQEGLKSCMNCGVCTAICPAASFYNYDPRVIVNIVQSRDEEKIEDLLKEDTIWYCGQCMSCKTRCPRGNVPGFIIMSLRQLAQDTGYFTESEKGRQQLAIKRIVGDNILKIGYCVYPEAVVPEMHPEQGTVWDWYYKNIDDLNTRFGAKYKQRGAGGLRKVDEEDLKELKAIFDETGGSERFEKIERFSKEKAKELDIELKEGIDNPYINLIISANNNNHFKEH